MHTMRHLSSTVHTHTLSTTEYLANEKQLQYNIIVHMQILQNAFNIQLES